MHYSPVEKFQKAKIALMANQPFFAFLSMTTRLVRDDTIPTMCTDGRAIYWSADFVEGLTTDETMGVLAHEVLHIAFKHFLRLGTRNLKLWNMATDYAINRDVIKAGFRLPDGALVDRTGKYDGLNAEEIYALLLNDPEAREKAKAGGDDPGGCGGVREAKPEPSDKDGNGESVEQLCESIDRRVEQAKKQAAARHAGKLPGDLARLVKDIQRGREDWRARFAHWLADGSERDFAWSRPNRRHLAHGRLMPGYIPTRPNHVLFIVDSSGSVGAGPLALCKAELQGALDMGACDRVTVAYADTALYEGESFETGEEIILKVRGGGGTQFDAAMAWAGEQTGIAGLVFFTDLATSSWGEAPPFPVLWAAHGQESYVRDHPAPYGETMHVLPD